MVGRELRRSMEEKVCGSVLGMQWKIKAQTYQKEAERERWRLEHSHY
jgi:hypothetical protein